jgi:HD-GYP domain-containing protein (c-di-GMP phosphodiesterase class II)
MRRLNVDLIKGNERLARPIYTSTDMTLLSQGVLVKKTYVSKLKELGIDYIYVEDELSKGVELHNIIEEETREKSKKEVKKVLERFSTQSKLDLSELIHSADDIIEEVLHQKEILINITDIRKKDEFIYGHSVNVCALSVLLGLKLGFNKKRVKDIAIGALLHDIGKVLIPNDILNKTESLTLKEEEEIRKHVIYGFEAIKDEVWLNPVSKVIVLTHHERVNGSGYPFKWSGDKIHDASKIVAICDVFDNLISNNLVGKPLKIYEAIEYLMNHQDQLFDSEILKCFIENVAIYPSGVGVITNTHEKGIVLRQNKKFPSRPVIRVIEDCDGTKVEDWKEIDLTESLTTFIVDTIDL